MRNLVIILFLLHHLQIKAQPVISENGYPEHFVAGVVIGGATSYFVYKKTNNKFKAWVIGAVTATTIGYLKEVVDPKWFGRVRNTNDFKYTAFGGLLGASIVIPLRQKKPKPTPNIAFAFEN